MPNLTKEQLDESIELAETALYEIAEFEFVGDFHEVVDDGEDIYSLRFVSNSPGFRDWWWTVTLTRLEDADAPTVLECGLLPSEDALLAPEWVPWAKRLARFRATHDAHGNPLPEGEETVDEEAAEQPRARTRKRTRTRLRRRGDSARVGDTSVGTEGDAEGDTDEPDAAAAHERAEGAGSDELPVAADIRDYAEEMDEALDGVTFEDDEDAGTDDEN